MKVAVLLGQINFVSGVGIAAVQEVRELRKIGVDAELVVLLRIGDFNYRRAFEAQDIPIVFISDLTHRILTFNFKFPRFSYFSFYHLSSIIWAPPIIKKRQYDAIIVHESYNCFTAITTAKNSKTKVVTYMWDPISYIIPRVYGDKIPPRILSIINIFCHYFDRYILKNSDVVITGSSLHRKLFNFLIPGIDLAIVPAGTKVKEKITFHEKKIVLSLTKWDKGKNPDLLIEIANKLNSNYQWFIAGNWVDNQQRIEFEKKIGENKLSGKIKVLGAVSEAEKIKLYNTSRILVHPIIEAFGMPILEAAACGCPSLIPRGSGVTDLFTDGIHGYYPKEGDLNEFVDNINLLLNDDNLSQKMGKAAWQEAKKYSWSSHAKRIYHLLCISTK